MTILNWIGSNMQPSGIRADYTSVNGVDVNNDGKVALAELIYILQSAAALR